MNVQKKRLLIKNIYKNFFEADISEIAKSSGGFNRGIKKRNIIFNKGFKKYGKNNKKYEKVFDFCEKRKKRKR